MDYWLVVTVPCCDGDDGPARHSLAFRRTGRRNRTQPVLKQRGPRHALPLLEALLCQFPEDFVRCLDHVANRSRGILSPMRGGGKDEF